MKTFIIKTVNLLLIGVILAGYQQMALTRAGEVKAYEKQEALAAAAWEEANAAAGEESQEAYKDGTYTGTGTGFGGEIVIEVVIQDGSISTVEILSAENETPDYLKAAEALLDDVIEKQSSEVDTVSGATLSSNGILEGIRNALEQAE